MCVCGVHH
uniref:Uncharacterized protein n=1 Tax=Anguilla anguilla TaxID=7936 RepID=A0A0E9XQ28_ANGAN